MEKPTKFEDLLLPGVKMEDFVRVLDEEDLKELEKSRERQRQALKRKEINYDLLKLRITI